MKAKFNINGSLFNNNKILKNIKNRVIEDGKVTNLRVMCCKNQIIHHLRANGVLLDLRACELDRQVRSYLSKYEK